VIDGCSANCHATASNPSFGTSLMALFNMAIPSRPLQRRIADVTDGTSNTVALSEVIVGPLGNGSYDIRGWYTNNWGEAYSHYLTPNSTAPDVVWNAASSYCTGENAPCSVTGPCWSADILGARSRHPGGVNTCYADGSVHFVPNSIAPSVWQALGSINGGETNVDY
jgi:prepilin-type processing-associated H-X9-DG protein